MWRKRIFLCPSSYILRSSCSGLSRVSIVTSCLAALRQNWKVPVVPVFNQADGKAVRLGGQALLRRMAEPIGLTTFFDIEERGDIRCISH